jgi:hypothetical protein
MGTSASNQFTQTEYITNQSYNHSNESLTQQPRPYHTSVSTPRRRHPREEQEWAVPVQRQRYAHGRLEWPLPPDEVYSPFQLTDNFDSNRYLLRDLSPRVSYHFVSFIFCLYLLY